jgi:hypothetical protein
MITWSTIDQAGAEAKEATKVEWHSMVKEITAVPVGVMAPVEVVDERRAVVVEVEAVVKAEAVATHD